MGRGGRSKSKPKAKGRSKRRRREVDDGREPRRGANARGEWTRCRSWRRFFVALNEWLSDEELCDLLLGFYEGLALSAEVQELVDRWLQDEERWAETGLSVDGTGYDGRYRAFVALHQAVDPSGEAWIEWVRTNYPEPPGNFELIGRPGNRPLWGDPSESPRVRPVTLLLDDQA